MDDSVFTSVPQIPLAYAAKKVALGWREVYWGYQHRMFGPLVLVEYAKKDTKNPAAQTLAAVSKKDTDAIEHLAHAVVQGAPRVMEDQIRQKLQYVVLAYVYERRKSYPDALEFVEGIYADFGYPTDMRLFVRYMPADFSVFDPKIHTAAEANVHFYKQWHRYLELRKEHYKK